jgi:hypothetical protein
VQLEAGAALPPFDRNVLAINEMRLRTWSLWQLGQVTEPILVRLKTNSSNSSPHSLHSNSYIGICFLSRTMQIAPSPIILIH